MGAGQLFRLAGGLRFADCLLSPMEIYLTKPGMNPMARICARQCDEEAAAFWPLRFSFALAQRVRKGL